MYHYKLRSSMCKEVIEKVTYERVASICGCARGTIYHRYGSIPSMLSEVLLASINIHFKQAHPGEDFARIIDRALKSIYEDRNCYISIRQNIKKKDWETIKPMLKREFRDRLEEIFQTYEKCHFKIFNASVEVIFEQIYSWVKHDFEERPLDMYQYIMYGTALGIESKKWNRKNS